MNSTQNKKIEQVKETTMIVGIDVGSEKLVLCQEKVQIKCNQFSLF